MNTHYYFFSIYLTYEQCLAYYKGHITAIQVIDDTGKKIRFPAAKILPYMSNLGIRGRFRLSLDDNNKFIALERV